MNQVEEEIESLRQQLNNLATDLNKITDERVIALSQKLDRLLNIQMTNRN